MVEKFLLAHLPEYSLTERRVGVDGYRKVAQTVEHFFAGVAHVGDFSGVDVCSLFKSGFWRCLRRISHL